MEKLSVLVAMYVALAVAFTTLQLTSADLSPPAASASASAAQEAAVPDDSASYDEWRDSSYDEWSEFQPPLAGARQEFPAKDDAAAIRDRIWFPVEDAAEFKRKWGNNKARMWGKRDDDGDEMEGDEKRAWKQKTSRLWGKRMDADDLEGLLQDNDIFTGRDVDQDKRKWSKNKARMWGKRSW